MRDSELEADKHFAFFAFAIQPQKENAARAILKRRGFSVCVPIQRVKRRMGSKGRSGPRETLKRPAFPGYIFVYLSKHNPELHEVFKYRLVRAVAGVDGQIGRIVPSAMAEFLRRLGEKPKPVEGPKFKPGEVATAKGGAYEGRDVVVEEISGQTATVLGTMFGRPVRMKIAISELAHRVSRKESRRDANRSIEPRRSAPVAPGLYASQPLGR